jgi:hypothetical protein
VFPRVQFLSPVGVEVGWGGWQPDRVVWGRKVGLQLEMLIVMGAW